MGKEVTDSDTVKYRLQISIDIVPENRYGDKTGDGVINFTKEIRAESLSKVIEKFENLK